MYLTEILSLQEMQIFVVSISVILNKSSPSFLQKIMHFLILSLTDIINIKSVLK